MKDAVEYYRSVIGIANWRAAEDGTIDVTYGEDSLPLVVERRQVVLPTMSQMKRQDQSAIAYFNPLRENMRQNESPVMARFRTTINLQTHLKVIFVMSGLLELAASPTDHSKLTPDQMKLIVLLKDVNQTTCDDWAKVKAKLRPDDNERRSVRIYIRNKAVVGGKTYSRGAIVSFPLYEALKEGKDVYDVKLSQKSRKSIMAVMEAIFPQIAQADAYSRGSVDNMAPSFDCLIRSASALISDINDTINLFSGAKESLLKQYTPDDWADVSEYGQFEQSLRLLPSTTMPETAIEPQTIAPVNQQPGVFNQPQMAQQMPAVKPAPKTMSELLGSAGVAMQPVFQPPPVVPGGGVAALLNSGQMLNSIPNSVFGGGNRGGNYQV
jgi:hypothetical protein